MDRGVSPVADLLCEHGVAVVTVEGPFFVVRRQVPVQGHRVAKCFGTILTGQGGGRPRFAAGVRSLIWGDILVL